ncbi:MAG: hypothetical protein GXX78_10760 [Bacteroidales bacterium]|nr:hypothetical protein [Bacteroidales bacterium]
MKILRIIALLLIISCQVKADIIYSPFTDTGIALSLEGIGSYEIPLSTQSTINFWGGFGAVSVIDKINHPAFGGEIAFELRHYFSMDKYSGFNLGLYSGLALMRYPTFFQSSSRYENSVGFVPGLKLTYKKQVKPSLVAEPYIGISTPWYSDDHRKPFETMFQHDHGFILTIGLRVGFNKVFRK